MIKKMTCFMCRRRPAKTLTAHDYRDANTFYANAVNVVVFCSVRCAANWGLLNVQGPEYPEAQDFNGWHWCQFQEKWIASTSSQCSKCNGDEE